ncbi:polysaccharide biosynthesis protein [Aerococcus agrisoli]|uniref:Polysaccharide biosynthesis protein n=1 Tax=Aerococcus agrisoli TaxID=2487350 RepID=A0A3N4GFA5_9LACT|nr:oligosaccharide flippase family protein [Aerococcus agrisoli]RPA60558.1 polysaccharide biosynthesis protein [Aerococcus agrisoli]
MSKKKTHVTNKQNTSTTQKAMQGAAILTLAAFIAKILSAIYRVPLQNLVGNTGFYVYQQVYPIYGIGMTFALNGLPSFIGKQVALAPDAYSQKRVMQRYSVIVSIFAAICFAIVYFGAGQIATMMGDALLAPVVQSVSYMFLLMPILLLSRGYLQGLNDMVPTAISQVVEQLVRVAVILTVAYLFAQTQLDGLHPNVYTMGFWAMQSAWVAAAAASVVMVYYWLKAREKNMYQDFLAGHYGLEQASTGGKNYPGHAWGHLTKAFVTEGFVICFFSALLVFYQLVDAFTVYDQLVANGMPDDLAKNVKGIYDRGQPIVQLGMVVATALATSFLPTLAKTKQFDLKGSQHFEAVARQYLRVTLVFSIIITGGLVAIMPQLNHFLFASREGSGVLMVYVLMVVMASYVLAQNNVLQAMNRWYVPGIAFVIGMVVKMILTPILVTVWSTMGAAWATNIGLLVMVVYLEGHLPMSLRLHTWTKAILSASALAVVMVVVTAILAYLWHGVLGMAATRFLDTVLMAVQIFAGVLTAWVFLRKVPILTQEEWLALPKGDLIWRVMQGSTLSR